MKLDKQDLKYDQTAIYRLDDECDIKPQDLADPDNMGFATVVKLIWGGLLHKNPKYTIQYVLSEYDDIMDNVEDYMEAVLDAFEEAFPEAGDEAKN